MLVIIVVIISSPKLGKKGCAEPFCGNKNHLRLRIPGGGLSLGNLEVEVGGGLPLLPLPRFLVAAPKEGQAQLLRSMAHFSLGTLSSCYILNRLLPAACSTGLCNVVWA